jgi:hypothetical protein
MTETPFCPNPECVFGRDRNRSPALKMIENNVYGSGTDIMSCSMCQRKYYVSYKIDKIERMDPDTGEVIA